MPLSIALLTAPLGVAGFLCVSCVTMSLQSPEVLAKGTIGIGVHVGYPLEALSADSEDQGDGPPLIVQGALQFGIGKRTELGFNGGMIGLDGNVKVGLTAPENPVKFSLIAGVSIPYFSTVGFNVGVLGGYTVANALRPYLGYRHHVFIAEPAYFQGDLIGGLEILVAKHVGFLFELNRMVSFSSFENYSDDVDLSGVYFKATILSGGLVFKL